MIEPLDAAGDNSIKELGYLWPPGAGKTTAIEGLISWRVVCTPSNILVIGQKDDTADTWAETRLHPQFKRMEVMRPYLPQNRHQNRKSTIIFPHGVYLDICGPSMSNLQEKSMPWVFFEEAWRISENYPGRMKEGEARTHDKWNSKVFYIGQAGQTHIKPDDDDALCDLYKRWLRSSQRTYHFECPECGCQQPYKWSGLRYDKISTDSGETDWKETGKTVRYECVNPECDAKFHDTAENRRMLASSLVGRDQYRAQNPAARDGCEFFHCNILPIWRVPWIKSVMEFEDAVEAMKRGDKEAMKSFVQKRLCEFWTPSAHEQKIELTPGGYLIEDYESGRVMDGELGRCITVDVQQVGVWFTIFVFTAGGMALLACGDALSLDEIEEKRKKYNVPQRAVLVDSQYRPSYVYGKCAELGYVAFKGVPRDNFTIHLENGESIKTPYSKVESVFTGSGKRTFYINFCTNPIKDAIHEMRAGRVGRLMTPDNVDARYQKHLDAEAKRTIVFGHAKTMKEVWTHLGKRPNHMLDCTMAAVGYGSVKGWVSVMIKEEKKESEE